MRKIVPERDFMMNLCRSFQAVGKKIVLATGAFDIIHPGHIMYLTKAKSLGSILIVGVMTDESILSARNKPPINPLADRIEVLGALSVVDYVTSFAERAPIQLIRDLHPDIYVKGGEYKEQDLPETTVVHDYHGNVTIIPYRQGYSTTNIIGKITRQPPANNTPL